MPEVGNDAPLYVGEGNGLVLVGWMNTLEREKEIWREREKERAWGF